MANWKMTPEQEKLLNAELERANRTLRAEEQRLEWEGQNRRHLSNLGQYINEESVKERISTLTDYRRELKNLELLTPESMEISEKSDYTPFTKYHDILMERNTKLLNEKRKRQVAKEQGLPVNEVELGVTDREVRQKGANIGKMDRSRYDIYMKSVFNQVRKDYLKRKNVILFDNYFKAIDKAFLVEGAEQLVEGLKEYIRNNYTPKRFAALFMEDADIQITFKYMAKYWDAVCEKIGYLDGIGKHPTEQYHSEKTWKEHMQDER